ncbi:MAG: DUF2855 family protein [Bacteroidota bacterium]
MGQQLLNQVFRVHKKDIHQFDLHETELGELAEGEIRLKISHYAMTSNNITYAVSGFQLGYWKFFPTDEPFGIIPVWGYADVVASHHAEIQEGERCYGYFPMSTYCTFQPTKVTPMGFTDGAAHRQPLPALYNNYTRVTAEKGLHQEALQHYVPIIHPLFATSFLIYQFLKSDGFMGAEQVIITSASSKTSLGLAFMLSQHKALDGKQIIGFTSSRNADFVEATGYYDQVITYEDNVSLAAAPSVVVDMRGNHGFLSGVADHLGDLLKHIVIVGLTDWQARGDVNSLPNAKLFFAPSYFQNFFQAHGPKEAGRMLNEALMNFIRETQKNLELAFITDTQQLAQLYGEMVQGKVDPTKGYVVKFPA